MFVFTRQDRGMNQKFVSILQTGQLLKDSDYLFHLYSLWIDISEKSKQLILVISCQCTQNHQGEVWSLLTLPKKTSPKYTAKSDEAKDSKLVN